MFARCTTMQTEPGMVDQAVKAVSGDVLDQARTLSGFKGLMTFVDRHSGKGVTFTLWESDEARQASVDRANTMRENLARELHGTILDVENYELVVDERG